VRFEGGRFSTLALSDGQKRRLALLVAFLEDAELYLFDEWAADQDPHSKAVFYERILPGLKARGKAVVAISHDDRYFHLADRLLVMQEGLLVPADEAALLTGSLLKSAAHAPLLAATRAADAVATGAQAR
jgi:putative ATP-binding cassette transporter